MRVRVKNYLYRHFDNMFILQTEDDTVLYIYCPSECLYDDEISKYYCYTNNILDRVYLKIDYIDYHTESNSFIQCDGVAHFVKYNHSEKNAFHRDKNLSHNVIKNYWRYFNDSNVIEKDRNNRQWSGFVSVISDMAKQL